MGPEIIEYIMVLGADGYTLATKVQEYILRGYQPLGNAFCVESARSILQAMVKYKTL